MTYKLRFVHRRFPGFRVVPGALVALLLSAVLLSGCVSLRDTEAIADATALKKDTLALMGKAADPYPAHAQEITDQSASLQQAYDAARARPNNGAVVKMWTELLSSDPQLPGSGIYPRFVSQWQTKGTLKPVYIEDKKETVGAAFDQIIGLEKARPTQ